MAGVLVVLFAAHAWASSRHKSPTVDEFAHVPAGYVALTTGDFTLYGKTPPAARLAFSAPLLLRSPVVPDLPPGNRMGGWYPWLYASSFFRANLARDGIEGVSALYAGARAMVIVMAALLAVLVFVSARAWHGGAGAFLAVAVFTLDPNVIAHSRLATVDIPETLFFFAAVMLFVRVVAGGGRRFVVAAGLAGGLAAASKFTAFLLAPILIGLVAVAVWRSERHARARRARSIVLDLLGVAALAVLVVNVAYGFNGSFHGLGDFSFRSRLLTGVQASLPAILPVPLPEDYLRGFDAQQVDLEVGDFPNYLAGRWSRSGWWYYYPLSWLLKSPLVLVLLVLGAPVVALLERFRGRRTADSPDLAVLSGWACGLAVFTVLFAACFLSRLNIGIRYLLPAYPFIAVATGRLARIALVPDALRARLAAAVVLLLAMSTLTAFPHYLAFFNVAGGGVGGGWKILANSNADWGQDLPTLRSELRRFGANGPVRLAYFGHADPEAYGIDYTVPLPGGSGADALLPGDGAAPYAFGPGLYAISANLLVGLPYQVVDHGRWVAAGSVLTEPQQIFTALRRRSPDAVVGGSILVYDLREATR